MNIKEDFKDFLQEQDELFLSESHMQFDFAWFLKNKHKDIEVILEYPVSGDKKIRYIDIVIEHKNERWGIELKYKTKPEKVIWFEQEFELKKHGAYNEVRGAFSKDVERLECFVENKIIHNGVFIGVSNDENIWKESTREDVGDFEFRFYRNGEPRTLHGNPRFTSNVMKKIHPNGITFKGHYKFKKDCHVIKEQKKLFYSLIEVIENN